MICPCFHCACNTERHPASLVNKFHAPIIKLVITSDGVFICPVTASPSDLTQGAEFADPIFYNPWFGESTFKINLFTGQSQIKTNQEGLEKKTRHKSVMRNDIFITLEKRKRE